MAVRPDTATYQQMRMRCRTDRRRNCTGISEFSELFQQFLALGYGPGLVNLHVPDVALRVQDEGGALVHTPLLVEHAVRFAGRTMRPIIREQRERYAAQFLSPALEAGSRISTDIQNLAVQFLELIVVRTEPVDLVRSPASKRERHERDHDRSAAEAGKRDLLVRVGGEREIGRCTTCFQFQGDTPYCMSRQSRHRRILAHRIRGNRAGLSHANPREAVCNRRSPLLSSCEYFSGGHLRMLHITDAPR